jgi:hypothetical protein
MTDAAVDPFPQETDAVLPGRDLRRARVSSAVERALVDPVEAAGDEQELGRLGPAEPRPDLMLVERSLHKKNVRLQPPVDESGFPIA